MNAAMPEPRPQAEVTLAYEQHFPELFNSIKPELLAATRYIMGDDAGPYALRALEQYESGPYKHMTAPTELEKIATRFVAIAAGSLLSEFGQDGDEARANDLVRVTIGTAQNEYDAAYTRLVILATAEKAFSLRGFAKEVLPPLERITEDPKNSFELMKLLAQKIDFRQPAETYGISYALQILHAFDAYDRKEPGSAFKMQDAIEVGAFDSIIAEEILLDNNTSIDTHKNGEVEINKMLRLLGRMMDDVDKNELASKLVRPDMLKLWPDACLKVLECRKLLYREQLRKNNAQAVLYLNSQSAMVVEGDEQALLAAGEELTIAIARQRLTNTDLPARERLRAQAVISSKRRQRRLRLVGNTAAAGASHEESVVDSTRQLVHINSAGIETKDTSDEFDKVIDDYVSHHKGEPELKNDIRNMLDYLKTIDMSSGLPRGIQKLHKGISDIKFGDRSFSKIYRLSPREAVGISTSSISSEKVRIVFVMEKGTVGIVEIVDKDEFLALQQRLGLGRSHKK